jgi:hypothetical protein
VTNFKVNDKVKIRKLSEEEFEKVYGVKYSITFSYNIYLDRYYSFFNKNDIYIIDYFEDGNIVLSGIDDIFYPEELIKVNSLKTKLQLIRELIK